MKVHRRFLLLRCYAWTMLILLIGSLASCTIAPSSTINPPLSTIRVVMDNNYPPYAFEDDQGNIQGILVDQWKLWEERTGVKVDLSALPWGEALQRMKAGEFDVIDTIFYTDERAKFFDFTPAYAQIDVPIFFQNNISGIADASDLKGFRVAVKTGDADVDYLVSQGITDLVYYNSYEEIIQAAARRERAIFVIDQPPALYFLYKYGIQDQFNHSAPLYSGAFHRAVKKGNTAVLNLVLDGFSRISSSEYQAIDRRWLGTSEFNNLQQFVPYLVVGTAIVLLIILILIVFNRMLQKRVWQRTRELEETAAALHDSRHFLADLIEYGGALIFVKDRDGRYELINRKWEEVTGLKREEVIGKTDEVLFPGPVGRQFRVNDLEVIETGKVLEREEILEDARGKRYFISIKFPVRGEDGHLKGICGMTTEITERKRAEQALEESEEIFRLFMEHSPIYVFFKDAQTRAIRLSKNYEQMLGKSLPELLGKTMDELFPSELAKSMMADDLRTLREGKQIEVVEELNGRIYKTTKFPIIQQEHPGWLAGYTIDITEQKHAELALKESERLLNRSQAIAQVGHWAWDTRTNKVTWSDEMYRIFGIDRESFTGNLDDIITAAIHPDDKERVVKSNEAVLTEQKPGTLEYRVVRPDGSIRYVWAQPGDSVCDETGKIILLSGVVQDITERKRAEEALRASEERLRTVTENAPDTILQVNRAGIIQFISRPVPGLTREQVIGSSVYKWVPLEQYPVLTRTLEAAFATGQRQEYESLGPGPHGESRTYHVRVMPVMIDGQADSAIYIATDISERKHAEEALRQSEDKFSKAFHTSPDSVNINRLRDGLYLEINDGFTAITGYTSEDVAGKTSLEINIWANPADRARLVQALVQEHGQVSNLEAPFVMKDGRIITALMSAAVIEVAGEKCILSITRDITERKRAEEALRESEEKFRAMIEQASEGFALIDEQGVIIEWNRAIEHIWGLTREEVLGRPFYDVQFQVVVPERRTPEHYETLKALALQALRTGQSSIFDRVIEAELCRADGQRVIIQQSIFPIRTAHGYRIGSMSLDITERKRVEDEIRRLNEDLEQRVLERTRELAAANAQLTELDQLKSKFVSDVSHELRTPIANLKLYIDLLERGKLDKQSQYIRVLHQQVRRVAALVDDILDLSRLERRKEQGLIYRAVALNEVVEQVVLAHQPRAEADGLRLTFEPASPLPPVRADANQLAQVVTNLVTNALNYTPAGYVRVSTYAENGEVCLCVADSGSGIAAEDLPHIFERFYRGQRVLKNDMPGTGLGLAIVKEIVDLHEGHIEADSRPGHGTTFRVWLPLASAI